jgi:choline dehydrogenase-like flavoprotein
MPERFDVIIIGTGAGGGTLAHTLAPSGKRILLLERGELPAARDTRRQASARADELTFDERRSGER